MLQIQGQIYHRAGSLLPFPDTEPQFLQIYFVGNSNDELNRRCVIVPNAFISVFTVFISRYCATPKKLAIAVSIIALEM
jgi:hypothetical protein